jgi:hypothetical protein
MQAYGKALLENDEHAMLRLFAPGARVVSFLAGETSAPDFFKNLFANSRRTKLDIHHMFIDVAPRATGALHLSFDAVWQEKATLHIEAVDLFEFDAEYRITSLRVVLDTYSFKALQERLKREAIHA